MMNKLLITGGAGFIGTNIAIKAIHEGYDVYCMDNLHRPNVDENVKVLEIHGVNFVKGDIREPQDWNKLRQHNFHGIIHLAANPGIPWSIKYPAYDFDVNAKGTLNCLQFAASYSTPIPVIYASTNKVYSDILNTIPLKEHKSRYEWHQPSSGWFEGVSEKGVAEGFPTDGFELYAHSPYGVSKLTGDHYCQEFFHTYGVPTVINRMSCIYGFYQKGVADQGWIDHFVRQFVFSDKPVLDIFGNGKQVRDMLWGEDVADLYLKELSLIELSKGKIFNVGGGMEQTLSLLESIKILEKLSGKKAKLNFQEWRVADQKIYISDTDKVKGWLKWNPTTSPVEGITKMYEDYTKQK